MRTRWVRGTAYWCYIDDSAPGWYATEALIGEPGKIVGTVTLKAQPDGRFEAVQDKARRCHIEAEPLMRWVEQHYEETQLEAIERFLEKGDE